MERAQLSLRVLGPKIGVDKATLCRVTTGRAPSVENYLRICRWLDGNN
jgi:DNA-binding Xre family transcriptional regulator